MAENPKVKVKKCDLGKGLVSTKKEGNDEVKYDVKIDKDEQTIEFDKLEDGQTGKSDVAIRYRVSKKDQKDDEG